MSLQKKTGSEVLKRDIFIVHFSRQTNGLVCTPKLPTAYALESNCN